MNHSQLCRGWTVLHLYLKIFMQIFVENCRRILDATMVLRPYPASGSIHRTSSRLCEFPPPPLPHFHFCMNFVYCWTCHEYLHKDATHATNNQWIHYTFLKMYLDKRKASKRNITYFFNWCFNVSARITLFDALIHQLVHAYRMSSCYWWYNKKTLIPETCNYKTMESLMCSSKTIRIISVL